MSIPIIYLAIKTYTKEYKEIPGALKYEYKYRCKEILDRINFDLPTSKPLDVLREHLQFT